MASPAHSFYCFEVLAASYKQREYPDLASVVSLYEKWQKELSGEDESESVSQSESVARTTDEIEEQHNRDSGHLRLPSISGLRDLTPSSAASSSTSTSTPSSMSVNSSNTHLTGTTSISSIAPTYASRLSVTDSYPMFVTWSTLSRSGHKSLRGCIGTFEALPLEKGLESYALTSAFEDTRFSPISAHLLPNLMCSLTLLADFEDCDGPMDWEVGKHGIRISFVHRSRRYGATYLPDIASEQGWTQEETLESLMRKAGYDSHSRRFSRTSSQPWEEVRNFRVVRYAGLKAKATYSEWQEWQQWVKKKQPDLW